MLFFVQSSLYYQVNGPSTLLCSLSCVRTPGQEILEESLTTSRDDVNVIDIAVGMEENRFTKIEVGEPGDFSIFYEATVAATSEQRALSEVRDSGIEDLTTNEIPYLFPSRYAPADRMRAVATDLFGQVEGGQLAQALAVEKWLYEHISYQAGTSTERSWAMQTYEERAGVCRDFAHLGIAFCRALSIPARYVTVYAHQLMLQDFHAVFEVFIDGTWFLIDGTRIAPLNGMVRIAIGRDAADAAVATLFGNIAGQGIEVSSLIGKDETELFTPITREDLNESGTALFLA